MEDLQRMRQPPLLAVDQPPTRAERPVPELLDAVELLAHVRDDLLRRVRRCGRPHIGHQVEQGQSGSCPIAETTGVRHAATARISASSENGSRSSTLPPPRATTITSTSGSPSSSWTAWTT